MKVKFTSILLLNSLLGTTFSQISIERKDNSEPNNKNHLDSTNSNGPVGAVGPAVATEPDFSAPQTSSTAVGPETAVGVPLHFTEDGAEIGEAVSQERRPDGTIISTSHRSSPFQEPSRNDTFGSTAPNPRISDDPRGNGITGNVVSDIPYDDYDLTSGVGPTNLEVGGTSGTQDEISSSNSLVIVGGSVAGIALVAFTVFIAFSRRDKRRRQSPRRGSSKQELGGDDESKQQQQQNLYVISKDSDDQGATISIPLNGESNTDPQNNTNNITKPRVAIVHDGTTTGSSSSSSKPRQVSSEFLVARDFGSSSGSHCQTPPPPYTSQIITEQQLQCMDLVEQTTANHDDDDDDDIQGGQIRVCRSPSVTSSIKESQVSIIPTTTIRRGSLSSSVNTIRSIASSSSSGGGGVLSRRSSVASETSTVLSEVAFYRRILNGGTTTSNVGGGQLEDLCSRQDSMASTFIFD